MAYPFPRSVPPGGRYRGTAGGPGILDPSFIIMFRKLRIAILLFVLLNVAFGAWLARSRATDWEAPLDVVVYAMNGDGSEVSREWIAAIAARDREALAAWSDDIESFFRREARRHGLPNENPVDVAFGGILEGAPPEPPRGRSLLSVMAWSLKLRWWAWRNDDYPYPRDVLVFVRYFDPETTPTVAHSLGLQEGLIGVVNAFASKRMRAENHVVIAHELLHTLGATDKYDPATNLPRFPDGYADPYRDPLHPQDAAEIMAGRIAVEEYRAAAPRGLGEVVIGASTAAEIRWTRAAR